MILRAVRWLLTLGVLLGAAAVVRPSLTASGSRWGGVLVCAFSLFNLWQFRDLR